MPIFIANVDPALGEIDFGAALDGDVNGDGVLDEKDVKAAFMEADGRLSVIKKGEGEAEGVKDERKPA